MGLDKKFQNIFKLDSRVQKRLEHIYQTNYNTCKNCIQFRKLFAFFVFAVHKDLIDTTQAPLLTDWLKSWHREPSKQKYLS